MSERAPLGPVIKERVTRAQPLRRAVVVWVATAIALLGLARALPGVDLDSRWSGILAAAVISLLNGLVWPLVIAFALPLTVLTLGLAPLLLNSAVVVLAAAVVPGFHVDTWVDGLIVALGVTVVTSVLYGLLAIDDDDLYQRRVTGRALRRQGLSDEAAATAAPGIVFLQIDGLSHPVLQRAMRNGYVPGLASLLERGSHRLHAWETDWTSQTGASQAGILLGSNWDMPAFRWLEKDTGRLMVSNQPRSAALIEATRSQGQVGLLAGDGVSRNNIFTGGATQSIFTMSVAGRRRGRIGAGYFAYFSQPYNTIHTLIGSLSEIVRENHQSRVARRHDVRPRVHRGGVYPLLRAFTTVLSRDVTTATVIGDVVSGRAVVYCDFLGYDEVAHHSGVERHDALGALSQADRSIARIVRACELAGRRYHVVVLSDHGQSQGPPFRQRWGETLGAVVRRGMGEGAVVDDRTTHSKAGEESWGYAGGMVTEVTAGEGTTAALLRRMTARSRSEVEPGSDDVAPVLLGKERENSVPGVDGDALVLGSGSLGLVHLIRRDERLTLEEISAMYPDLLPGLVGHPGIGFVMVRSSQDGPVALGRDGLHRLGTGEVVGVDPLPAFGPSTVRQLLRADSFPHCPDIMVNAAWNDETQETYAFEDLVGSHGGLGGDQSHPFVLHPTALPMPGDEVHGAEALHRVFRGWLADLGHPEPAAGPPVAATADPSP